MLFDGLKIFENSKRAFTKIEVSFAYEKECPKRKVEAFSKYCRKGTFLCFVGIDKAINYALVNQ